MAEGYSRKQRLTESQAEKKLLEALGMLKAYGLNFRRQAPKGGHIVNFTCDEAGLVIELDPNQVPEERQAKYNETRIAVLEARGFRFLRFWSREVDRNLAKVMAEVMAVLREQHERKREAVAKSPDAEATRDETPALDALPRPRQRGSAG